MKLKKQLRSLFQSRLIFLLSLLTLGLVTSCGYHTYQPGDKTTVSIPYVEGDEQGELTSELIHQLDESRLYTFVREGGDLILKVSVVGDENEIIGFKFNRHTNSGEIERNLMPTENRRNLAAEVTLVTATDEVVLGPIKVTASADYDYIDVNTVRELAFINEDSQKREKTINFSLGQLDSIEGAQDNVLKPVYHRLAKKIMSAVQKANFSVD